MTTPQFPELETMYPYMYTGDFVDVIRLWTLKCRHNRGWSEDLFKLNQLTRRRWGGEREREIPQVRQTWPAITGFRDGKKGAKIQGIQVDIRSWEGQQDRRIQVYRHRNLIANIWMSKKQILTYRLQKEAALLTFWLHPVRPCQVSVLQNYKIRSISLKH